MTDGPEMTEVLRLAANRQLERLGWTRLELSIRMKIGQGTVSKLLNGQVRASRHVPLLLKTLGIRKSTLEALERAQRDIEQTLAEIAVEAPERLHELPVALKKAIR